MLVLQRARAALASGGLRGLLRPYGAGTGAGAPPPEVQAAKEAAQEAAKQPDAQQGLAHGGRTSITSVSDPVFDYLSQPYERPKKNRAQARQPPPHTSLSSATDPAYDYMQQHYSRPNRGKRGRPARAAAVESVAATATDK